MSFRSRGAFQDCSSVRSDLVESDECLCLKPQSTGTIIKPPSSRLLRGEYIPVSREEARTCCPFEVFM